MAKQKAARIKKFGHVEARAARRYVKKLFPGIDLYSNAWVENIAPRSVTVDTKRAVTLSKLKRMARAVYGKGSVIDVTSDKFVVRTDGGQVIVREASGLFSEWVRITVTDRSCPSYQHLEN